MSAFSPVSSSSGGNASSPQRPERRQYGFIPVQMTNLVPVRVVSVHGDFFDTEVHQDAPLRTVQKAVEDCFKVRPELQLLTHNRKPINPNVSLRRNGCLLLKGDPYVKIVLDVKKGSRLNIVCQMAHCEPIPLVCEAEETIWDIKRKFCKALAKEEVTPQRVRLLWRYWELNDKATVDYYHIPTNSKLTVMKKRDVLGPRQGERRRAVSQRRDQGHQQRQQAQIREQSSHEYGVTDTNEVTAWAKSPPPAATGENYRVAPSGSSRAVEGADDSPREERARNEFWPEAAVGQPPMRTWPAAPQEPFGRAVIPLYPIVPPRAVGNHHREPPDGQALVRPLCAPAEAIDLTEVRRLREEVEELGRRMESCVTSREEFLMMEESFRAAVMRVSELEESVGRVQNLLKRALVLM